MREDALTNADNGLQNRVREEMCDITPLGTPLPAKEGSPSLKGGVTVRCSAVTFFSHLF